MLKGLSKNMRKIIREKNILINKLKNEEGVTLAILVITIVVMLILTGLVINLGTGNSEILNVSKEEKAEAEALMITEEIKSYLTENPPKDYSTLLNSLKRYGTIKQSNGKDVLVTTQGKYEIPVQNIWNVNAKDVGIKIGTSISYPVNTKSYTISATNSGTSINQTINVTTGNVIGRVFNIDKETGDIYIVLNSASDVRLKGANGYNNGTKILNDLANTLYSNPTYGITGRNATEEDIAKICAIDSIKTSEYGVKHKYSGVKYPNRLLKENIKNNETSFCTGLGTASNLTLTNNYYSGNMKYENSLYSEIIPNGTFWLSSISISANTNSAGYFLRTIRNDGRSATLEGEPLFNTSGAETESSYKSLPIMKLNTNNFSLVSGSGTKDNPYVIGAKR